MLTDRLLQADREAPEILEGYRNPYADSFFLSVTALGSVPVTLLLVGLLALHSEAAGRTAVKGVLGLWAVMHPMKALVGRERPETGSLDVNLNSSFPSGHAGNAVLMAGLLAPLSPASWPLIAAAFTVCLSRLYLGSHHPADVAAGAGLGALVLLLL